MRSGEVEGAGERHDGATPSTTSWSIAPAEPFDQQRRVEFSSVKPASCFAWSNLRFLRERETHFLRGHRRHRRSGRLWRRVIWRWKLCTIAHRGSGHSATAALLLRHPNLGPKGSQIPILRSNSMFESVARRYFQKLRLGCTIWWVFIIFYSILR